MIAPSDPGCVPRGRRGEEGAETPWSAGEAPFADSSPFGFVAFAGVMSLGEEAAETPWSVGDALFAASSPFGFVAFVGVVSLGEEAAETPWSVGDAPFAASSPFGFVAFVGVVSLGEEAGEIVSPSERVELPASSPLPMSPPAADPPMMHRRLIGHAPTSSHVATRHPYDSSSSSTFAIRYLMS